MDWYIQGDYVLDQIFHLDKSSAVNIIYPEGLDRFPEPDIDEFYQDCRVPVSKFFPPSNARYNTDLYLITEGMLIYPIGFPAQPRSLSVLPGRYLGLDDVIRGVKTSLNYPLLLPSETETLWVETLSRVFLKDQSERIPIEGMRQIYQSLDILKFNTPERRSLEVMRKIEELIDQKFTIEEIYGSPKEIIELAETDLGEVGLTWEGIKDQVVLDIGCGDAHLALAANLKEPEVKIVSVDINPPWVPWSILPERVRKNCLKADAASLPFAGDSFDLVIASGSVQAQSHPEIMREISRILKSGG